MAIDKKALIIPGKGTVFHAPVGTPMPTIGEGDTSPLQQFSLTGATPPTPWVNIGHTSKDNTIKFTRDGGDTTQIDTFLEDAVDETRESVTWGLSVNSVQFSGDALDLAFNGDGDIASANGYSVPTSADPQEAALLVYAVTPKGIALGFYIPNTKISLGDAPEIDPTALLELPLTASILSAPEDVIPAVNGKSRFMKIFKFDPTA